MFHGPSGARLKHLPLLNEVHLSMLRHPSMNLRISPLSINKSAKQVAHPGIWL